jgi:uncharacterized protein with von Willebrand factor type A (vWA) domain
MCAAAAALDAADPRAVYWAGRLTLCGSPADIEAYDRVFHRFLDGTDQRKRHLPLPIAPAPRISAPFGLTSRGGGDDVAPDTTVVSQASELEVLRYRDFSLLSPVEREESRRLIALLAPAAPLRPGRRLRPARRGRVDPRRTLRRLLRHGGEPGRLATRKAPRRPRRLVLLVDVSGSMAAYSDALLRFAHAAVRVRPSHTEVYSIGTRLTRLTRAMRTRDPQAALTASGDIIEDWRGGTRLGEQLWAFTAGPGHRGAARGAVVIVFSDGWERGDPQRLADALARLKRLAHKVVWVTPHAGRPGFAPEVAGLRASQPFLDALVAGHSVAALAELVEVVADA